MGEEKAFRGAFGCASSLDRLPFRRTRNATQISEDVGKCFEFSREAGLHAFPIWKHCDVTYRDIDEEVTFRLVEIRGVFAFNGKRYFEAFCQLRNDTRTFLYERIQRVESYGNVILDTRNSIYELDSFLECPLDYSALSITDLFVHPRTWGDYRRPVAILFGYLRAAGACERESVESVRRFCIESFQGSRWEGWRTNQQALALALLGLAIDTSALIPEFEQYEVRGGRFNKAAFERACMDAAT